jgi:hypothetical protein
MTFQPELGQALFGQPHQEHEVPDIWDAALCFIRDELERVMWNVRQKEYASPFANAGERFDCPTFSVHAYSWDESKEQPWNFKWRDVEISWYKYLGRGMSANRLLSPELAAEMLAECLFVVWGLDD